MMYLNINVSCKVGFVKCWYNVQFSTLTFVGIQPNKGSTVVWYVECLPYGRVVWQGLWETPTARPVPGLAAAAATQLHCSPQQGRHVILTSLRCGADAGQTVGLAGPAAPSAAPSARQYYYLLLISGMLSRQQHWTNTTAIVSFVYSLLKQWLYLRILNAFYGQCCPFLFIII